MTSQTPAFSKPIRVVVADDSAFMRRLISDALTERGAQVVGVGRDGDEALALCAQHRPDVLSLDLAMPGKDGIGVLRELRRIGSPVAVVVVSAPIVTVSWPPTAPLESKLLACIVKP